MVIMQFMGEAVLYKLIFFQMYCLLFSSILENNRKRVNLSPCFIGQPVSAHSPSYQVENLCCKKHSKWGK